MQGSFVMWTCLWYRVLKHEPGCLSGVLAFKADPAIGEQQVRGNSWYQFTFENENLASMLFCTFHVFIIWLGYCHTADSH